MEAVQTMNGEARETVTEEAATYTATYPETRTEAAPLVTPDGSRLLARRPGRELFPASWLRHKAAVSYEGGDLTGTLLEWCGAGLIVRHRGRQDARLVGCAAPCRAEGGVM